MKKKYKFTEDSSFTSLKDKMHRSVTEHIVQDDKTKKLYHIVVSYGSWYGLSHSAIFMSHLLPKIGITGFAKSYIADGCSVTLPYYPHREEGFTKSEKEITELPIGVELKDFEFGRIEGPQSEKFKQTFLGKEFKIKIGDRIVEYSGDQLVRIIFGFLPCQVSNIKACDGVYPYYELISNSSIFKKYNEEDFVKILTHLEQHHLELIEVMKKFIKLDIVEEICEFEKETGKDCSDLLKELLYRQTLAKTCFYKQKHKEINEKIIENERER